MNPYLNFSLEGKVALVTGASYGIGFAIASAFAEQGATICFNDINQELVDKGLAAYEAKGIKAHGFVCDVTDEPAVQAMVATIAREIGTIDILVNNAGIIRRIPMHEMDAAEFRRVVDIDLNAPFIVAKAVLPAPYEAYIRTVRRDCLAAGVPFGEAEELRMRHLLAQTAVCKVVADADAFYAAASRYIVEKCQKVIALWDERELPLYDAEGRPVNRGGTYHSICMAQERGLALGKDIHIIHCDR